MADKLFTYVIILLMLSLLFGLFGTGTAVGATMSAFGITSGGINWHSSQIYGIMIALIAAGAIAIYVGFISKSSTESGVLVNIGLITLLLTFVSDFIAIINYGFSQGVFAGYIGLILLAPLYAGFVISIIQFWRGTD